MPVAGDGLAALAPRSDTLFVQLTAKTRVNRKTCSLQARSQVPRAYPGWFPSCQSRSRLWMIPEDTAVS
jgi:hypothetical protein